MKTGLLFQTAPKETLADTLTQAIARYREKYSTEPTTLYLNPQDAVDTTLHKVASPHVLPKHLWLELEETNVNPN